jgi:hypothetical protein
MKKTYLFIFLHTNPFVLVSGEMDETLHLVFYSFLLEKIDIS